MTASKQRPTGDVLAAASGRWPEILQSLGGLTADQLENRHQPCPACGGTDRYRWDRDEGEGGAYCSQCGGKDHQGGGMSGLDLLMRVKGWHLIQAIDAVGQHLGLASIAANNRRSTGKPYRCPDKPPADAPPPALDGAVAQWCYRDTTGAQLYWVQRYPKRDGSKGFTHRVWLDGRWHRPNTSKDGFTCDWPAPRPMYGLPGLVQRPDAPVLVVEGEKAADAAALLLPDWVVVSWSNGSNAIGKVDWQPLAGRSITLWPDNDAPGKKAMLTIAARLVAMGGTVAMVRLPEAFPDAWDVADPMPEGFTAEQILREWSEQWQPPEREKAPPSAAGGRRVRLAPDDVLSLLPQRVGRLRLNVRTGDVHTPDGVLSGNQISRLYLELSNVAETWPKDATSDAVMYLAHRDQFDPVREWLEGLSVEPLPMEQWERLDRHLLGIDDPIASKALPRYLIGAIARTMDPGCYVRQTPVLIGPQERGKTELGRILFGAEHWVEGVGALDRDALQRAGTAWGVELAELDGVTRRRDQEQLKAFLTECIDTYQIRYDRCPEKHPRRFVFWATANRPPLRDSTGSTRFVCIPIPDRMLPLDWAREHRGALWARALEQYRAGVTWLRTEEQERREVEERNSEFIEHHPWADDVATYLARQKAADQIPVTVPGLLNHLGVPRERHNNAMALSVRQIAEQLGWQHGRRPWNGRPKAAGLFPPSDPGHTGGQTGHTGGHTADTPADPSQGNGSSPLGHTGHPISGKGSEKREGRQGEPAAATAPTEQRHASQRFDAVSVCPVCPPRQTDCSASDLPDCPGVSTGVSAGVSRCVQPDRIRCLVDGEAGWSRRAGPMRGLSVVMTHDDGRQLSADPKQVVDLPDAVA